MQTVLRIKQLENDDFIIKVGYQKREFFQKEKKSQHKSRVCKTLKLRITRSIIKRMPRAISRLLKKLINQFQRLLYFILNLPVDVSHIA